MSFLKNYRTPFGYVADGNQVDAYGVDHSGFSTRDELQYQFARQEREKQMADDLKQQGIEPENYPQLGTTFWGNNPENNYGFGNSNISANIENRQNQTPLPNVGKVNQGIGINNNPTISAPSQVGTNNFLNASSFGKTMFPYNDSNKASEQFNKQNQYINSALFPKSMANDDMSYKLAQNNLSNTAKDWYEQTSSKYQKLIGDHYNEIYKNEGNPNYIYLDPKYIRTIGRGKNIDDPTTFNQVKYKITGTNNYANVKEKQNCYNNFSDWIKKNRKNPQDEHNFKASYFKDFCNLYIDANEEKRLHQDHVVNDIPVIKNIISNYDELNYEKQLAILDMVYNLGATKFKKQFTNFIKAANANSEEEMLAEYHRQGISEARNKWTADLLRK